MKEPVWVLREVVFASHQQSLARFGGSAGLRDEGLLDSALGKPLNQLAYGKPTFFELAASHASGIVKNHPFVDGNKRTGFVVAAYRVAVEGMSIEEAVREAKACHGPAWIFGDLATYLRKYLSHRKRP